MTKRASVLVAGVDAGTTCVKAVVLRAPGKIVGRAIVPARGYFQNCAREALAGALEDAEVERAGLARLYATGFGARRVEGAARTVADPSCHAAGAFSHCPQAMTVLDIGGQFTRASRVDAKGRRLDYREMRKCSMGPGLFLDLAARQLDIHPSRLQELADAADEPAAVGSYCSLFSSTDLLEHLREGASRERVARGCLESIAERIVEMGLFEDGALAVTGGVAAYYPGVLRALAAQTGRPVQAVPEPILAGALGAALKALAAEDPTAGKGK